MPFNPYVYPEHQANPPNLTELLVDKAMELRFVGGVYAGNIKPTPFLCLILKMLQIQPEKDIIVEFIKNEEFKYVRALGAFYLRLTASSVDCCKYLEPLYNDNRKLRRQKRDAHYEVVHMDEFIDELLRNDRVCDVILPRLQKRAVLEENNDLEPRVSCLDDDLDEVPSDDEPVKSSSKEETVKKLKNPEKESRKDKEKERERSRRDRDRDRSRSRSRSRDRDRREKRRDDHHHNRERDRGDRKDERDRRSDRGYERRHDDRRDRYDDRRDRDRRRH